MLGELIIRDAVTADLQALQSLYQHLSTGDAVCSPDEAERIFARLLLYPGSTIVVGEVDSRIVTTCTLVVIPNLTRGGKSYGLIENVVTNADWRGFGFGRQVLSAATERAWAAGCYKVMLMTGSTKPQTLAFYERAGFAQSKTGFQIRRHPVRPD
ncbi:GNAT family N-acetyltransferase [Bradyrhizobium ontarionense]|uniref:GNAT family N-acetyltransferase n=2 Tax=Bradyrhizobium ontarionense TaxID=2898149 RepID=A0ABY3RLZ6_9BRAD|nr:GNAT family N-acetyltransferase [Bradyrhizobium sp. A19]UFZ08406.1 GNAT family N-acetyltransferase [Bradyrhizobium sp. A19]